MFFHAFQKVYQGKSGPIAAFNVSDDTGCGYVDEMCAQMVKDELDHYTTLAQSSTGDEQKKHVRQMSEYLNAYKHLKGYQADKSYSKIAAKLKAQPHLKM